MGPLALLAHVMAALFLLYAAYFVLLLGRRAAAESVRPSPWQKLEAGLPLLAIFAAIPASGVLLDHAAEVLASGECPYLSPLLGPLSRDAALALIWAALCLTAAVPIAVVWSVDRDLSARLPALRRLAHRAAFRALIGVWPSEPARAALPDDERWKRLLQRI